MKFASEKVDEINILRYFVSLKREAEALFSDYSEYLPPKQKQIIKKGVAKMQELMNEMREQKMSESQCMTKYPAFAEVEKSLAPIVAAIWQSEVEASLKNPNREGAVLPVKTVTHNQTQKILNVPKDTIQSASVLDKNFMRLRNRSAVGLIYKPKSERAFFTFSCDDAMAYAIKQQPQYPERFPEQFGTGYFSSECMVSSLITPKYMTRECQRTQPDYNEIVLRSNEIEPFAILAIDNLKTAKDNGVDVAQLARDMNLPILKFDCKTQEFSNLQNPQSPNEQ